MNLDANMTEKEKAELKLAIEERKTELEENIAQLRESTKPMGLDNAVGRVSRMDYINNKSVRESVLRESENELKGIERWLSLYGTSAFGKCSSCGSPINPKRLLILPASSRCIKCA